MCSSSLTAEPSRFRWVSRLGRSRPTGRPILEGYLRGFPPPRATGYRKTIVETLSGRGSEP